MPLDGPPATPNNLPSHERERRTHAALTEADASTDPTAIARWRQRAVLENYGLACSLARRYAGRGVDTEDLQQVGLAALVVAVHRFDPAERTFTAYAVPTITGEIKKYFRDHAWAVRPPRRLYELHRQVQEAGSDLAQELGTTPTDSQIADRLGVDVDLIGQARYIESCFSTAPLESTGGAIASPATCSPDNSDSAALSLTVRQVIDTLPERDRFLLQLRFEQEMTQAQIGEALDVSQMQISRRLSALIARVRTCLGEDFLEDAG